MRLHFITAAFVVFAVASFAQPSHLDSLKSIVEDTSDPKLKVELYISLGKAVSKDQPKEAIEFFTTALEACESLDDKNLTARVYNQMGVAYYDNSDLEKSTENYFTALKELDSQSNNDKLKAIINSNIGKNFLQQKDYARAIKYFNESKKYYVKSSGQESIGPLLNDIGIVYKHLGQYDKALESFEESLSINKRNNNTSEQLHNINNIGVIHLSQEQYELAIDYFKKALYLNYELNDMEQVANNLHNLGRAMNRSGRTEMARDSLLRSLEIANGLHLADLKYRVVQDLYSIYVDQENYKEALNFFKQYKALDDSLFRSNQYTAVLGLEAQYNVHHQELTIKKSQNLLLKQKFYNTLILSALIGSVIAIGLLFWIYFIKKRNEKHLIKLNREIDNKNLKIQAINQNLEKLVERRTQTIAGQNDRLKEFAFLNSHKIRRPLSSILGLVELYKGEKDPEKIEELTEMLNSAAKELDQMIFDISHQLQEEKVQDDPKKDF